jgi:hypothetical protein
MSKDNTVYIPGEPVETLDHPRFDFSNVSYRQGRESGRIQVRIKHLAQKIEAATASDDIEILLAEFDSLMDQQEKHIFAAVSYLPQSWLIKDAPLASEIDWQDASSIKYLRADKLSILGKMKNEAQNGIGPN